jgi:hypothetical protein
MKRLSMNYQGQPQHEQMLRKERTVNANRLKNAINRPSPYYSIVADAWKQFSKSS